MLLKTSEELKLHFSNIERDYKFGSISSFVDDSELDLIIPEISQGMYDALQAAYDNSTLAGKLLMLHKLVQKAITHFALYLSSDSGSFHISDSGFYVSTSADRKPVSDKKLTEFRKGRKEAGYKALEKAIEYLESNIDEPEFEPYATSDQHLAAREYFINTAKDFTKYFKAINSSSVTFRAMLDAQGQSERRYLISALGDEFYESLKEKILDNDLNADEIKLLPYIQRPLANYTVAEALPVLPVEFDGSNLFVNSLPAYGNSENVESKAAAGETRLSILMNKCIMVAEGEMKRLTDYLVKNAAKFPLYVVDQDSEDVNVNNTDRGVFMV